MSTAESEIQKLFDADNHYWEVSDSFTRHRDPAFAERGVVLKEVNGKPHYFFGERQHPIIPGPGDVHPRPRPGALYDYFAGKSSKERVGNELACEDPGAHPEWFDRDARLACMDAQGVEAAWLFPSQGVCMEGPMQPDVEASIEVLRAFNRWLDDDWGFSYEDRIFAVPFLTLSDLDRAVGELEWCLDRGARVITIRNGPVFTAEGLRSPADPAFDPFWARIQESGIVVTTHAGFEDGYTDVASDIARTWGLSRGAGRRTPSRRIGGPIRLPGGPAHEASADRGLRHRAGGAQALRAVSPPESRLHRERGGLGATVSPLVAHAGRSEPRHVRVGSGRPVRSALLGGAFRGGQRGRPGALPAKRADPLRLGLAARRGPFAAT